jgi:hypothetical protein
MIGRRREAAARVEEFLKTRPAESEGGALAFSTPQWRN